MLHFGQYFSLRWHSCFFFKGTDGDGVGGGALAGIPSGVKVMGAHLQRKFARGVQYNMKVIIKGERNTGKSTLLYRLQGYKFVSDYNQTEEIQVAVIHWTAATSATEVVKVSLQYFDSLVSSI